MAKEKFERLRYLGPVSSLSAMAEGEDDRALITGVVYDDLPPGHPVVQNLKVHHLLVPADDAEAPIAPAVTDSPNPEPGDDRSTSATGKKPARKAQAKGADQ